MTSYLAEFGPWRMLGGRYDRFLFTKTVPGSSLSLSATMRRENYICLTHRTASRLAPFFGSYHCPVDGAPMTNIGTRRRVPKRADDRGWRDLAVWVKDQAYQREMHNERYPGPLWGLYHAERLLKKWRRQ